MKKRLLRFILFASTVTSSALNEWELTGRIKWRSALKIVAALFPRSKVDHGPGSFWWKRMRGCIGCHVYDRQRKACGLIGETYGPDRPVPLGCGCYIPLKAESPWAECWLWEQTDGGMGVDWAKTLRKAAVEQIVPQTQKKGPCQCPT